MPLPSADQPVLRFAPSPNGYLHTGHAYSVLLNAQIAAQLGGRLLLRIEDIDVTRCRPELEAAMLEDLDWLGVAFDTAIRRQSDHFELYRGRIGELHRAGLTYRCFCSRARISAAAAGNTTARTPDGGMRYPGLCRNLSAEDISRRLAAGEAYAIRLRMDAALARCGDALSMRVFDAALRTSEVSVDPWAWGDVVLARKETPTSYHVSVVVDDDAQGVTHVVRGRDLEAATAIHRVLQELWALPAPLYHHHGLIRDEGGAKLAKSLGSTPLRVLRAQGTTAAALRARLGFSAPIGS